MAQKVFWYHYHKQRSKDLGKTSLTVHYNKQCLIVDNIKCNVPTFGCNRTEQPRFVIKGKCKSLKIENGIAIID